MMFQMVQSFMKRDHDEHEEEGHDEHEENLGYINNSDLCC